ncbi:hypothetical protein FO519_003390 [Halicephalobus sp. NKZ332]|nr:hypothetical protein FO519_003390 [Halicephalobus sp. NKZ332]
MNHHFQKSNNSTVMNKTLMKKMLLMSEVEMNAEGAETEKSSPNKTPPSLGLRLSHSISEQNLASPDFQRTSNAFLHPPQLPSSGQLKTSPSNHTLASGASVYFSPIGSGLIPNSRPAGSAIYDSKPDLAAFTAAISHSYLHKQSGTSNEYPTSGLIGAERHVAGNSVEGFYNRIPDRPNFNNYIHPNARQVPIGSSENSTSDGLEFAHQSVDANGPAFYNKPRFVTNIDVNQIDKHRGELSANEKYRYDLSRAQLKATSRTSALLAGFAMVALVELQYDTGDEANQIDRGLLIVLGVVTTLLVSVHLIALMMSTCLLPHIEANGCTQDSPHNRLHFYIELSWLLSICIGLLLFLLEIGVIFFVKFDGINFRIGAYITTALLVPVFIAFVVISYLIHRDRFSHSVDRVGTKVGDLENIIEENSNPTQLLQKQIINMGIVKQVSLEWLSEWPPEMILKLFQLVKPHPYLYDQSHNSFHNRTLKGQTWTSIAKSLDRRLTSKRCRDRFVLYRRRYISLMRKQMKKGQNAVHPEFNWLLKAFDDVDHGEDEKDNKDNSSFVSDEAEPVLKEDTSQSNENDDSVIELMKALTKKINEKIPISQAPMLSHDILAESFDENNEDQGSLNTKMRGFSDTESEQELHEIHQNEQQQFDLMTLINQIINIPQQEPIDEECDIVGKLFALDLQKLNKDNRLLALNCVAAILSTLLSSQMTDQIHMDTS